MTKPSVYLDIETNWSRRLTVIGFRSARTGLVQLVGTQISRARLKRELPLGGNLFTFNGECFDLPCIEDQLGIDLRDYFESVDLRWVCYRNGLTGGQKRIERRFRIRRRLPAMCGKDAAGLWHRYRNGDEHALRLLLQYNAEDVDGLAALRRTLHARRMLRSEA